MNDPRDIWKARMHAVTIRWPQRAPLAPDRAIAFTSAAGLCRWDTTTGALEPIGPKTGFGLLSPDGRFVYYFQDTKGNEHGHYLRVPWEGGEPEDLTPDLPSFSSSTTPFPLPIVALSASGNRIAFIACDRDGYHLWSLEIAADGTLGTPTRLHGGRPLLRGPIVAADGSLVVCCSNARTGKQQYDLVAVDTSGTTVATWSEGETASLETVAFSPLPGDLRLLATSDRSGYKRPMLWNLANGEQRALLPETTLPGELVPLCWSPDAQLILLCRTVDAAHSLAILNVATGAVTSVEHPTGTLAFFGGLGATLSNESEAQVLFSSSQVPQRLMAFPADRPGRVVLAGPTAPPGTSVRSVRFPSSDGAFVQAWLSLPDGAGPFPTVIDIHGGPHGVTCQSYGMGGSYVTRGMAYLSINYRGSTTFGREFLQKIWGDVGHWELEDVVAAREFLVREGIADPTRIVVTGGSYGGYLTLLALGKRPELWAAGVATVAIADNRLTFEDASPLLQGIMRASFGGTPDEKPELFATSSPSTYLADLSAPVLIIQGKNDTRCPARQMEVYEAQARTLGKAIEVIWFDAGHGVSDPTQATVLHQHALDFLERTLGLESPEG